jgi:hypothetical protein
MELTRNCIRATSLISLPYLKTQPSKMELIAFSIISYIAFIANIGYESAETGVQ